MNKIIMTMICIIVVISAVITAVAIYIPKNEENEQENNTTKIAEENIVDECTEEYEEIQNELLQANATEEKISPKASITFKKIYKECGHTTSQYLEVSEELVNNTKQQLQEKYSDWNIDEFSDTQIVLSKDEDGECGEHYIVRDNNGKVTIYQISNDGAEQEYEVTDISTEYLTQTDKINMQKGIRVNGKNELNQLIEDFE